MLLQVKNIEKNYMSKGIITKVLKNVSFNVEKGDFLSIMGASGSGKTTLLNCISTIDRATVGDVYVNNTNVCELQDKDLARFRREQLGFIFQDSKLLNTLTINENIALPLTINNCEPKKIPQKVSTTAEIFGISHILEKYPYEVSGGERQRGAAARAIITGPSILLADEPTGALDSSSANKLMETLSELNRQMRVTILLVTHDPMSASYSNRVLFLKDGNIYNQCQKGNKTAPVFYKNILDALSAMGGDA